MPQRAESSSENPHGELQTNLNGGVTQETQTTSLTQQASLKKAARVASQNTTAPSDALTRAIAVIRKPAKGVPQKAPLMGKLIKTGLSGFKW